jgi:RNA polymerase sigma-70 factor (ECF subfamily)
MPDRGAAEEKQLLNKAQLGDAEAYARLYDLYAPRVFRFLSAHLDQRLDAEDLTEEVFLRTWRSLASFRWRGVPFSVYLMRVARNALIDHYRHSKLGKEVLSLDDDRLQDASTGSEVAALDTFDRDQLRRAMSALSEDYRTVLSLRFLAECSPQETARVMGRSTGAIRVLQHRALLELRKKITELD